jgi:hypothetical protein
MTIGQLLYDNYFNISHKIPLLIVGVKSFSIVL